MKQVCLPKNRCGKAKFGGGDGGGGGRHSTVMWVREADRRDG